MTANPLLDSLFWETESSSTAGSFRADLERATEHLDASTRTRLAMILDGIERQQADHDEALAEAWEEAEELGVKARQYDEAAAALEDLEAISLDLRERWQHFHKLWERQHGAVMPKELREAKEAVAESCSEYWSHQFHRPELGKGSDLAAAVARAEAAERDAWGQVRDGFRIPASTVDITRLPEPAQEQARKIAAEQRKANKWHCLGFVVFCPTTGRVQAFSLVQLIEPGIAARLSEGSLRVVRGYKC